MSNLFFEKEIWREIENYEKCYQISNFGRIKSLRKNSKKIRKLQKKLGYSVINLCKNYKSKNYFVHRIVAKAFIPNPENKPFINHKDCDKSNNHVSNLEWCDQKYNVQHAIKNGKNFARLGEKHGMHKLTEKQVKKIRNINNIKHGDFVKLSKKFNVSAGQISYIFRRKSWKHI